MQPIQGWENVGPQTQGSARRATLGFVMPSRWDWLLSSPQNVQTPGPLLPRGEEREKPPRLARGLP